MRWPCSSTSSSEAPRRRFPVLAPAVRIRLRTGSRSVWLPVAERNRTSVVFASGRVFTESLREGTVMRAMHLAAPLIAAGALGGIKVSLQAQGTDLIEGGRLEGRGVVFESPVYRKFSSMETAVGLGDVNGD